VSKAATARLLDNKRRFVALYCSGPEHKRGKWAECNKTLGTSFEPEDEDIQRLLVEEGCQAEPGKRPTVPTIPNADWTQRLEALPAAASDDEWCKLAKELRDTYQGIAEGSVKATAAQVSALHKIYDRCYGKVAEKRADRPASGVLVLPALGDGSTLTVCPKCGYDITQRAQTE